MVDFRNPNRPYTPATAGDVVIGAAPMALLCVQAQAPPGESAAAAGGYVLDATVIRRSVMWTTAKLLSIPRGDPTL